MTIFNRLLVYNKSTPTTVKALDLIFILFAPGSVIVGVSFILAQSALYDAYALSALLKWFFALFLLWVGSSTVGRTLANIPWLRTYRKYFVPKQTPTFNNYTRKVKNSENAQNT